MSLSALLRRAKSVEAADGWQPGTRVGRAIDRLDDLRGRVGFVDAGWIYWVAEDGALHASTPDTLKRLP